MKRVTATEWSLSLIGFVFVQAPKQLLLAVLLFSPPAAIAGLVNPTVIDTISIPTPSGVAYDPSNDLIYVASGGSAGLNGMLSVIDPATDTVFTNIVTGGLLGGAQGVAVNPVTNSIYLANVVEQTVPVVDASTDTLITTITGLGPTPRELAVNPVANMIYVGNEGNGTGTTLSVINGATNAIVQNITVGRGPEGVAVNPITNRIYTANQGGNTVSVINGSTNTVIATVPVGSGPSELAIDTITNRLYVANSNSNTISVIDTNTNTVIDTIAVGDFPRGLSLDPVSNQVYLVNENDDTFSVINGNTDSVIYTIPLSSTPVYSQSFTEYDPTNNRVYVSNYDASTLTVIASIPEPSSILLISLGTLGVVGFTWAQERGRRWIDRLPRPARQRR